MNNATSRAGALLRIALTCGLVLLVSCKSSEVQKPLSAEERFALGKQKFDDKDYVEAIVDFTTVKLQFSGSSVGDDAQYYLGECHYMQEEYLVAAEEYQTLRRSMPSSPLVPLAQYKTAMCYYDLSPKSSLDQVYTKRAVDEFQTFIEYNPTHELVHDAEAKIQELNTKLSKKLYDAGRLYMKMENYKAAVLYFELVIEKYHDTEFAGPAYLGKARALVERKHYGEARDELDKFDQKYPDSQDKREAQSLRREVDDFFGTSSKSPKP
jgi:outer membrane protein assembly factor BamD